MKEIQKQLYENNVKAGWWDITEDNKTAIHNAAIISALHAVLSDQLEEVRTGGSINIEEIVNDMNAIVKHDLDGVDITDKLLLSKVALIHSEVTEVSDYVVNLDEKDKHLTHRSGLSVEISDTIMRLLDLAERYDIDVSEIIEEKLEYNKSREDHKKENRNNKKGKKI